MKQKFIRTILGPILKDEMINTKIKNNSFNYISSLPFEHIIQNLCSYLNKDNNIDSKNSITLSNLNEIMLKPFSLYQNLYLDSDVALLSNELNFLKKYNTILICEVTSNKNGKNLSVLREISKLTKINICFGLNLEYENLFNIDLKKISNEIQYNIIYGKNDDNLTIPSFLGEEIFDKNLNDNEKKLYKMICSDIINKYQIPLYIKLINEMKNPEKNQIINFFNNEVKLKNKKKIIFCIGLSDNDLIINENNLFALMKNILNSGFTLNLNIYECDITKQNEKIDNYYNPKKIELIKKIILIDNKKYIEQILLSNNINFKINLKQFGSFGYENLFINYFPEILNNLNEIEIKKILYENLFNLLEYWTELEKIQKDVKKLKCENCGIEKNEDDKDLFSKFDKIFCSFKCLKEYIKNNPQ